ncbi:MAG: hypothetical protein Q8R88_02415 [Desulfoprunum sp.]|nr:hypothetical protein [Desulfoprunum sp.]
MSLVTEETAVLGRMILRQRRLPVWTVTFAAIQLSFFLAHVLLKEAVIVVERQSGRGLLRGIEENAEDHKADQNKDDIQQEFLIFLIENHDLHEKEWGLDLY